MHDIIRMYFRFVLWYKRKPASLELIQTVKNSQANNWKLKFTARMSVFLCHLGIVAKESQYILRISEWIRIILTFLLKMQILKPHCQRPDSGLKWSPESEFLSNTAAKLRHITQPQTLRNTTSSNSEENLRLNKVKTGTLRRNN